ncbi:MULTISPECIES: glucosamine-6-phosphate deaminase [unclassified Devosia]|uniref:glucosamine-6-phosphate deaminase n=1 Tax=unclassified Devosia TaxID=196773 RepID=UPI0032C03041
MSSSTPMPEIRVFPTAEEAEISVAAELGAQLRAAPASVLGLATGNSMIGVYRELVRLHRDEGLSFAGMTSFNLDEYCGLAADDPSSFAAYMHRHLFDLVDADTSKLHLPDGNSAEAGAAYEASITAAGGIELQLLGIGRNGHIGFNEPGSPQNSRTRIVELAQRTREVNATDFPPGAEVPHHAVTMGIATILDSRRIILLATGAAKAEALADAMSGAVRPENPASFLQTHPRVTLVCDEAAAALLPAQLRG